MTQMSEKLSIQQAAAHLIRQNKNPMTSREIVKKAQEFGLVRESKAKDPDNSFIQTLERNIRMGTGNHPPLKFVYDELGNRFIDLEEKGTFEEELQKPVTLEREESLFLEDDSLGSNQDIMLNVKLYMLANGLNNEEEAINQLLRFAIKAHQKDTIEKIEKLTKFL